MQEITLRAMRFHALVGILPHERLVAQPIEVDLRVRVTDGEGVIDYRALYDLASAVFTAGPIDFLEQIAERIAEGAIQHNARIRDARVAVRKPHVGLPGPLAYAEVVIERSADG
jgi:7,8-dihydroneopterin aldolase/epimerase/oxygenase